MTGATSRKSFGSDNHAGTHPAVMRAIVEANTGDAVAYGADPWTEKAVGEIRRLSVERLQFRGGANGAQLEPDVLRGQRSGSAREDHDGQRQSANGIQSHISN